jgi:hypothetical protein
MLVPSSFATPADLASLQAPEQQRDATQQQQHWQQQQQQQAGAYAAQ